MKRGTFKAFKTSQGMSNRSQVKNTDYKPKATWGKKHIKHSYPSVENKIVTLKK